MKQQADTMKYFSHTATSSTLDTNDLMNNKSKLYDS